MAGKSGGKAARIAIALPLALVAIILGLVLLVAPPPAAAGCDSPAAAVDPASITATVPGWTHEQLVNAAQIMLAGQRAQLTVRDQQIGVMTAIGESTLRVLNVGDAAGPDSRGLFQQRANGAWGSLSDRMDPFISASNFFKVLAAVPGRANLSPTAAAHQVQGNANPDYYTPFWDDAGRIVTALTGQVSAASTGAPSAPAAPSSRYQLGAVLPHTALVANTLGPMFGITTVGGYRPANAGETNYDPAGHPAGRALDFMLTGTSGRSTGDKLAAYAQANAADLDVTYIIWRQRIWSVDRADEGWRPMPDRGSATANHLDHVHISLGTGWTKTNPPPAASAAASGASCATTGALTAGQVQPGGWAPPAHGPILSTFGPRVDPVRGAAGYGFHYGIDIGSACNNPIWAANAGTVIRAGIETTGLGNVIEIDHGNGVETRYGHMYDNGILVRAGDQVTSGQQIARIGSNGNSTGCHLHWETLINQRRVDPQQFMVQVHLTIPPS